MLWMLVSGALLPERGALFPALQRIGLSAEAMRRAWASFRGGQWRISDLVRVWRGYVEGLEGWVVHRHEGYRALTVDITAFFRPTLQNCPSRHYHPQAQQALPAVIMGVIGEVGEINGQRLACPHAFERVNPKDPGETRLREDLLRGVKRSLAPDEVFWIRLSLTPEVNCREGNYRVIRSRFAENYSVCLHEQFQGFALSRHGTPEKTN